MFEFTVLDIFLIIIIFFAFVLIIIIIATGIALFFDFTVKFCSKIEELYEDFLDNLFS